MDNPLFEMNMFMVKQFWEWFSKNCQNFGEAFENEMLLSELDNWIKKLGDFGWEVGPGIIERNALVISPGGDEELLEQTKQIVDSAVACEGWEYYYAKPPKGKEWNMAFTFETETGNEIEMDASDWKYVLLRYADGMIEIIIEAVGIQKLDEPDRQIAAEIVTEGLLGEEARMKFVCGIDLVEKLEEKYKDKATSIKFLFEHFSTLVKG